MKPEQKRSSLRLAVAALSRIQVRDASGTGDGSWTIEGYASVYEQETTLFEIPEWYRVREEIARGAFENVLQRLAHGDGLVHLNHGHDMKTAMAATDVRGIGQLELADDFHGLRFFARVDQEDPDAKSLAVKMGRKVVRQSSFAFTIADEELVESTVLDDGTVDQLWRITEIGDLYDVCVCAQGAYPQTESALRSLAAASLRVPGFGTPDRASLDLAGLPGRSPEGRAPIAPAAPAGGERETTAALVRAQVDATYQALARRTR